MNKITKKTIKRIKKGYHDDLMDAVEFLIDSFDEDKFDAGYRSCLEDLSVRSYQIATVIKKWLCVPSTDTTGVDDLAKVIEEYYKEALKQE